MGLGVDIALKLGRCSHVHLAPCQPENLARSKSNRAEAELSLSLTLPLFLWFGGPACVRLGACSFFFLAVSTFAATLFMTPARSVNVCQ